MASQAFEFLMGPLLVLVCVALVLFGIFTAQVYYYSSRYHSTDPRFLRRFVLFLWFLELLHTIFCVHMLYTYFITHFNDESEVENIIWSAVATVFLEIMIVSMTQVFYIYRIWKLSNRSIIKAGIPAIALFVRVTLGFVAASFLYCYETWAAFRQRKGPVLTLNIALSCGGFVDLVTTVLLSYYLYQRRSSFPRTKHIVDRLIYYALNTGALTMCFSMAILFTYNLVTMSLLWAGLVEIVSKLYANSMLVMLNARNNIRSRAAMNEPTSIPLEFRGQPRLSTIHGAPDRVRIDIFKETTTDYDTATAAPQSIGEDSVKNGEQLA